MQRGKKGLALLLVLVLSIGIIPVNTLSVPVYAADEQVSSHAEQLTKRQKEIYDALVDKYIGTSGMANGATDALTHYLSEKVYYSTSADMQTAIFSDIKYATFAFLRDYPQIFWAPGYSANNASSSISENGIKKYYVVYVTITLNVKVTANEDTIDEFNAGVKDAVDEIKKNLSANATMFDKYMAIHDWLCNVAYYSDNVRYYPSTYPETHTSYPLFHADGDGGVVCEGYAKAFKTICDEMGLTTMLVSGTAGSDGAYEAHMWNKVLMSDGNWYVVDATWDDQNTGLRYDYFLCGEQSPCFNGLTFAQDHIKENEVSEGIVFEYPEISDYGYSGYLGALTYSYQDGTLSIGGIGTFPEYLRADRMPWYHYMDEITNLVIGD